MFAIIRTGGKQYKVETGTKLRVEKLAADKGASFNFDEVLMVENDGKMSIGAPFVKGATVTAEIVDQVRGDKILVFKKKRRKNYRRTKGHRQDLTLIKITGIKAA